MRIVSGTAEVAEVELKDMKQLSTLLSAEVPENWPPENIRDVLELFLTTCREQGTCGPWTLGWYGILVEAEKSVLCGGVGFRGVPDERGMVEIGYSVLPQFQRMGIAKEMVAGLVAWALSQPAVNVVEADALDENIASQRVLLGSGFVEIGPGIEAGARRFRFQPQWLK